MASKEGASSQVRLVEVANVHMHGDNKAPAAGAPNFAAAAAFLEPAHLSAAAASAFDMTRFEGSAAEMLAAIRAAGAEAPEAAAAALRVASAAPMPQDAPKAGGCNDPFCGHDHGAHLGYGDDADDDAAAAFGRGKPRDQLFRGEHRHLPGGEPPAHRHMPGCGH